MSIREEFDVAWKDMNSKFAWPFTEYDKALWAAKWAMERCADKLDGEGQPGYAKEIRQLAKELQ